MTPPSPADPEEKAAGNARLDALSEPFVAAGLVVRSQMFGMRSLTRPTGKSLAGAYGPDLVFRLAEPARAEALALEGAHMFEPMAGRRMNGWVQVPPSHSALDAHFLTAALESPE